MEKIEASIITIGDELLIGQVVDTNSAWIAQEFNKAGIWIKRRVSVGDEKEAIVHALNEESKGSNILIITGGLGPTNDDITKQVLCEYFGGKLVMNEDVLKHIQYLFEQVFRRPFTERNRHQAEVPDNCIVLPNARGTAPGMWFEKNGKVYVSLPGVPHEMKGLITTEVLPRLLKTFTMPVIDHRTLLTAGIGESFLADVIKEWEAQLPVHLKLAYLPNYGMVRLRITGISDNKEQLEMELNREFDKLKKLVDEWLVTDKDISLQMALSDLLREKHKSLSTAESCTGGYIAHLITAIPGASTNYKGTVVCYDNEIKTQVLKVSPETLRSVGAVSEEVVREMVEGAIEVMNTHYAVAVSGIMGPDGGTDEKPVGTVWMAAGDRDKIVTQKLQLRFDRQRNIETTAIQALNLLRKFILANG